MTCRWNGTQHPRTIPGRHNLACDDETCRGCQPCTQAHCRLCGVNHHEGTCPDCLAETRETLTDIARMYAALPTEAEHCGVEGEAMMLDGPVANPEAWRQRGRYGHRYDYETRLGEDHPLWVLGTWELLYRDALDHGAIGQVTITDAAGYLDRNLTYLGDYADVPFEDFARDLRRCRAHLEAVLHDGEQRDTGAPCMTCRVPLERTWGKDSTADGWRCPRCRQTSTEDQYRFAVRNDYEERGTDSAARLPAEQLAARLGVAASTVRRWASTLKRVTEDEEVHYPPALPHCAIENGKRLYRVSTAEDIRRGVCLYPRGSLTEATGA